MIATNFKCAMGRFDPAETLEESIAFASEQLYPSIRKCFMLLFVMPVSTATAERSLPQCEGSRHTCGVQWGRNACLDLDSLTYIGKEKLTLSMWSTFLHKE